MSMKQYFIGILMTAILSAAASQKYSEGRNFRFMRERKKKSNKSSKKSFATAFESSELNIYKSNKGKNSKKNKSMTEENKSKKGKSAFYNYRSKYGDEKSKNKSDKKMIRNYSKSGKGKGSYSFSGGGEVEDSKSNGKGGKGKGDKRYSESGKGKDIRSYSDSEKERPSKSYSRGKGKSSKSYDYGGKETFPHSSIPTHGTTYNPTLSPTSNPTHQQTTYPTPNPTHQPTPYLTPNPTYHPTTFPTKHHTSNPTTEPTYYPTTYPSVEPSFSPTHIPSISPSFDPTPSPSGIPSAMPSLVPESRIAGTKEIADDDGNKGLQTGCEILPDGSKNKLEQGDTLVVPVIFQYAVGTSAGSDPDEILADIEKEMHNMLADDFLQCSNVRKKTLRRTLQDSNENNTNVVSDSKMSFAVGLTTLPPDTMNNEDSCPFSLNPVGDCSVIDGGISVMYIKDSGITYSEVITSVLNPLKDSMDAGYFNNTHPNITGVFFLGITDSENYNDEALTPSLNVDPLIENKNDRSVSGFGGFIIATACILTLVALYIAQKKRKRLFIDVEEKTSYDLSPIELPDARTHSEDNTLSEKIFILNEWDEKELDFNKDADRYSCDTEEIGKVQPATSDLDKQYSPSLLNKSWQGGNINEQRSSQRTIDVHVCASATCDQCEEKNNRKSQVKFLTVDASKESVKFLDVNLYDKKDMCILPLNRADSISTVGSQSAF